LFQQFFHTSITATEKGKQPPTNEDEKKGCSLRTSAKKTSAFLRRSIVM
jgi:hypothetical protein